MWSLVLGLVLIFSTSSVYSQGCTSKSDCLWDEVCSRVSSTCVSVGKYKVCNDDFPCATGQKCLKKSGSYVGRCVDEADATTEPPPLTWPDFHVDLPTLPDPDTPVPPVTSGYCTYDYDCPGLKECSNGFCIDGNSYNSYNSDYSSDSGGLGVGYVFLIIIVVIAKVIFWASCLRFRYARRVCRQRMVIVAPPTGPTTTTVNTTTSTTMNHPYAAMPPGYAFSNPVVNGGVEASSFPPGAPPPYSSPGLEGQGNIGVPSPMQCAPPPPYSNFQAERQGNANNTGFGQPTASRDNVQLIRPDSSKLNDSRTV